MAFFLHCVCLMAVLGGLCGLFSFYVCLVAWWPAACLELDFCFILRAFFLTLWARAFVASEFSFLVFCLGSSNLAFFVESAASWLVKFGVFPLCAASCPITFG